MVGFRARPAGLHVTCARTAAVAAAVFVLAATPAAPAAPPSVYAEFHPSFSDMMTGAVQTRHIKLGLALRARNWTYATYAVGELRGAFNRIARSIPTYEGRDTTAFLAMINEPVDGLRAAIVARDAARADAAYAELTRTCNQCHGANSRAYIVIRTPAAAMFPDQDFSPQR
jgi:hypothetical protein